MKKSARATVSSEDLTRERCTFKLTHVVVGGPHLLDDFYPQVSSYLHMGLSMAHGPLYGCLTIFTSSGSGRERKTEGRRKWGAAGERERDTRTLTVATAFIT